MLFDRQEDKISHLKMDQFAHIIVMLIDFTTWILENFIEGFGEDEYDLRYIYNTTKFKYNYCDILISFDIKV